jgi:hypothetical protein
MRSTNEKCNVCIGIPAGKVLERKISKASLQNTQLMRSQPLFDFGQILVHYLLGVVLEKG